MELFSDRLRGSGKLTRMRLHDGGKCSNYNYRKMGEISLRRKFASASFSWLKRSVLKERDLKRCGRRSRLQKRLIRSARKPLATLKKLYNCPKRVSARPYKPLSLLKSVRNVLLLVHLV